MASSLWTAGCILMILGAACAAFGLLLKYYAEQQEVFPGRAEASVVEIVTEPRTGSASLSEFRHCQVAVFEFYAGGKLIRVRDTSDTYPCRYELHQKVKICYNPFNPQQYRILGNNRWRSTGKAVYAAGIALLIIGCGLFLMHAARVEI